MSRPLVALLVVVVVLAARGAMATPKTSVSPVCAASKLAWTGTAACTRFKDGICATIPTCTALCPYLGGVSGCNFIDGGELESTLENYPTRTELQTTLEAYPTETELATTLEAYETKEALAETLEDYVKLSDVSSTYVTRTEMYNQQYVKRSDLGNIVTYDQLMGILQNYQRRAR